MGATNSTINYSLPVFVPTDKPAWLVDWNGAMTAIDTAIKVAQTTADSATTDIGGIEADIITINNSLTTINSAVSQLRLDTNANTGSINTINELIGNGTPTTTDKTLIGAINELNSKVYDFDLSDSHSGTITTSASGASAGGDVRSLLNSAGDIGKIYGGVVIYGTTVSLSDGLTLAHIEDLGLPTITTAYDIFLGNASGRNASSNEPAFIPINMHFNTDGSVDLKVTTYTGSINLLSIPLPGCIYFLKDMGD